MKGFRVYRIFKKLSNEWKAGNGTPESLVSIVTRRHQTPNANSIANVAMSLKFIQNNTNVYPISVSMEDLIQMVKAENHTEVVKHSQRLEKWYIPTVTTFLVTPASFMFGGFVLAFPFSVFTGCVVASVTYTGCLYVQLINRMGNLSNAVEKQAALDFIRGKMKETATHS